MSLLFLSALFFNYKRLLRYLRYLQQDSYLPGRFLKWVGEARAFDRRGSLLFVGGALGSLFYPTWSWNLAGLGLLLTAWLEQDPRTKGKIKLQMTPRAKRLLVLAWIFTFLFESLIFYAAGNGFWIWQIGLFQMLPVILVLALQLLSFDESRRQKRFCSEAKKRWQTISPYTIGITGSYGKTSTKDALGHLLQMTLGPTFWPPKGINTEMGITREIREKLRKGTSFAVIEMGAYGQGSIQRLAALTPPHAGIITGVGLAHLDRFGDPETIYQAKSELAQAIPKKGILICNGDNPGTRRMAEEYPKQTTLLYGLDNKRGDLDCWITPESYSIHGTRFNLCWKGKNYKGATPLLGKTSLLNSAGAFAMACALGGDPEFVLAALTHLKPVENRLEIALEKGRTYLKDAYNSNPEGFFSALEVLKAIPARKRILMTPGMIELADKQQELHEWIGQRAAEHADSAIIIGNTNRESLTKGLHAGGMPKENIFFALNRKIGFETLEHQLEEGDAVLIENDLPDLYEKEEGF